MGDDRVPITTSARALFYRSGFPLARLKGPVRVILMYHSVGDARPQSVSEELFREHLTMVEHRFRVVSLQDLSPSNAESEENVAVLTFDDGYRTHHEVVLPLLEEFDLKGCFFVPTGLIGRSLETWSGEAPLMDELQVRELARRGQEVGGHAVSHRKLTRLNPEEAREEVTSCRDRLTDICGQAIRSFAYPSGDFNPSVVKMVRESGFRRAVTVQEGLVRPGTDPLALPRIYVHNRLSPELLRAKMSRVVEWYTKLRDWIRSLV